MTSEERKLQNELLADIYWTLKRKYGEEVSNIGWIVSGKADHDRIAVQALLLTDKGARKVEVEMMVTIT